jgi:hypothetical protein
MTTTRDARTSLDLLIAQYGKVLAATEVDGRRLCVRELADRPDLYAEVTPSLLPILIGHRLTDADATAWEDLQRAVARRIDIEVGALDWREVCPHARPSEGVRTALEVTDDEIAVLLMTLVAS